MILTHKNYFTSKNKYITNSKIGDWLKDKNYFYKMHVTHELEKKVTDAMIIGKAVDCWLTRGERDFRKEFQLVTRRDSKSENYAFQLNDTMYDSVVEMVAKIGSQPAFDELLTHTSQEILQVDMKLGKFQGIAGIPDWYKIDGNTCIITDLKTSNCIEPIKYHYHCLDYGYYRQAAMYSLLLKFKYDNIENFIFRHLVMEKDCDGIYTVKTFLLDQDRVSGEVTEIMNILEDIKNEKEFLPNIARWDDAVTIGQLMEEF